MDFYKIGASNQTTIFDLPDDIMHNQISKYLLEDVLYHLHLNLIQ